MSPNPDVIDRLYEAAVLPELWPSVCERFCKEIDAFSLILFNVAPDQTHSFVSSPSMQGIMADFARSPVRFENIRPIGALERSPSGFARDIELMSREEILNDPVYLNFMRPNGLEYAVGCALQEPSGHTLVFDIQKEAAKPGFSDEDISLLNAYKADLARSALLTSRLAFQQAVTITRTLSSIGLPSAVLGSDGTVMAMNPEMGRLNARIRVGARDRISLAYPPADKLLQNILAHTAHGSVPPVQSLALAAEEDSPALVLHLLPVKRNARDVFTRSSLILITTPVGEVGPPDMRVICGLFDLTPQEARVARNLAVGASVDETAVLLGLSRETIRTYLKHIYVKTGTARQGQLVALLSSLRTPTL